MAQKTPQLTQTQLRKYIFIYNQSFIKRHLQIDQRPFTYIFKNKTVNDTVVHLLAGYEVYGVCSMKVFSCFFDYAKLYCISIIYENL